ncbi:MAG: DUF4838 domain-containing protein [Candidatus Brocadiia bacterium]
MRYLLPTVVALAAVALPRASAMELVREGKPLATVVVKAEGPQAKGEKRRRRDAWDDARAAQALVDWVEKITDAKLPIADAPPAEGPAIFVGAAAVEAGLDIEGIESPSGEGMRVVCDGRRLLIAGQNGVATAKAVCRFLEELGCRYFMDEPIGEVYPRTKTLSAGKLDITDKPGFLSRSIWGSRWTSMSLWKVWNGAGGISFDTRHAWGLYVDKELYQEHPEYFALRDDERRQGSWVCTSNPELRKVFARNVARAIEKGARNPSISPPDGNGYCQCPRCRAQDDPQAIEPSSGRVSMSNRYADFFDAVARRVAEEHPDSILNFYCYADYTQPPTFDRKLAPNLCAWVAPIRYCRYHRIGHPRCPSRRQLAEMLEGWARRVHKIAYRTYNYNLAECCVPFSLLSVWKHDVPYLKKLGCIGMNFETLENWEIYGPHMYLSIRLAYSPDADADALMDDYFLKFYGPRAGPLMKQYWMAIDEAFVNLRCHSGCFFALHRVYTPEFLARLEVLLDGAAQAAKGNAAYAERVALHTEGLRNAVQYIALRNEMNEGDFREAEAIYDRLYARNEVEMEKGYGNHYTLNYLRRFVGAHVKAGAEAVSPPNKLLHVLPDTWRLAYDPDQAGVQKGYHQPGFDDSGWRRVATYSNTLDAQGLPDRKTILWYRARFQAPAQRRRLALFFTEIDGTPTVYVNGTEVGTGKRRKPFQVDIGEAAREGENVVAVRVDHRRITELFLGGIIRPVLLIQRGE